MNNVLGYPPPPGLLTVGEKLGDVHRRMPACAKASHHGYGHTVRNAYTNSKAITNPKTCFQCFQMYKTHQL